MPSPITTPQSPPRGRGQRRTDAPSSIRLTIRFDVAEAAALSALAKKDNVPVSELVRTSLMTMLSSDVIRPRLVKTFVQVQPAKIDLATAARLEQIGGALVARLGRGPLSLEERTLVRDALAQARIAAALLRRERLPTQTDPGAP